MTPPLNLVCIIGYGLDSYYIGICLFETEEKTQLHLIEVYICFGCHKQFVSLHLDASPNKRHILQRLPEIGQ